MHGSRPRALLATAAVVAPTDAEADELALSSDLAWLRISQGRSGPLPSVEEARAHPWTPEERASAAAGRVRCAVGSPATVRARLEQLAVAAGVEEVMVLTMVHSPEARARSYELLAQAFDLQGRGTAAAAA